jgi:hypothetical protein
MANKSQKNSLSIRFAESVIFLRQGNGRHSDVNDEQGRSSILRGLLMLNVVKPTRISSIEVQLEGKTRSTWPEGAWIFLLSEKNGNS